MSTKTLKFYTDNYTLVNMVHCYSGTKKHYLDPVPNKACRYCKKSVNSGATFKNIAHAIPELLGNKWVISLDECDMCNERFAKTVDDQLAKYMCLDRTLMQLRGKRGVPQTGRSASSNAKLGDEGLEIRQYEGDDLVEIVFEENELRFTRDREPYIPLAVYKSFVKMAYSMLPVKYLDELEYVRRALMLDNHGETDFPYQPRVAMFTFVPGPQPFPGIRAILFRRMEGVACLPSYVFVIAFGNYSIQIVLPSYPSDSDLNDFKMPIFPMYMSAVDDKGAPKSGIMDFSSSVVVVDDTQTLIMSYEGVTPKLNDPDRGGSDG